MKVLSMKLKNEENDERSRGRMLGFDLPPLGPTAFWAWFLRPDRGRPTLHGWWAPITLRFIYTYIGGGRPALGTRFTLSRHSPPTFPDPIFEGRSQWREVATIFNVSTAHHSTAPPPPSPPNRWRRRTTPTPATPLPWIWSATSPSLHLFLYCFPVDHIIGLCDYSKWWNCTRSDEPKNKEI
jgi:hypothetical protein